MAIALNPTIKTELAELHPSVLDLLETLCKIPAPSNHEEQRAAFVKQWLEKRGASGVYIDSALNVVYPFHCQGKNKIVVLTAHTDTVFPDTQPFTVTRENGVMRCPGVGDDTANLALLMTMIDYALQKDLRSDCGILFVANAGEEGLGNLKGVRKIFADYAGRIAEFTAFDGGYSGICNYAVGSKRYRVILETEGGHSYSAFGNRNAIHLMASMIDALYALKVPKNGTSTYNVGTISGGTSVNTIAQRAEMLFEYRSDHRESLASMDAFFHRVIEAYRAMGLKITLELVGDRPCMGKIAADRQAALTQKAAAFIKAAGGGEPDCHSGSTDCNIPLSLGIPAIAFGGHLAQGAHTKEESLETKTLQPGLQIVAAHVLSYCDPK